MGAHRPLTRKKRLEIISDFKTLENNSAPNLARIHKVPLGQVYHAIDMYLKKVRDKFNAKNNFENYNI